MDRANHSRDIVLYAEPACRGQNNSCNASRAKVLLMSEVLIGRDKYLKPSCSAASSNSPFSSFDQPRSYAVETSCCVNDSRKGTGTP